MSEECLLSGDVYEDQPDTAVDIEEFKAVVKKAIKMSDESFWQWIKSEL